MHRLRCIPRSADTDGVTSHDDSLLDAVSDLSRLSDRQLLERLVRAVEGMEISMSAASDYMTEALASLDTQMEGLKNRIQADAEFLAEQVRLVQEGNADTAVLQTAAQRVMATATTVSQLAQPSVVADEEQPDVTAEPVQPVDEPVSPPPAEQPAEPAPVEDAPAAGGGEDVPAQAEPVEGGGGANPGDAPAVDTPPSEQAAAAGDVPGTSQDAPVTLPDPNAPYEP